METSNARRMRRLRLRPLASCLALAFTIGTGNVLASDTRTFNQTLEVPLAARFAAGISRGDAPRWQPSPGAIDRIHKPLPHERPQFPEATIVVQNCDDDGPGSLRDIIDNVAASGDTLDLSQLTCSTITLTSGAIFITQDDLTLTGSDASNMVIDGGGAYSLRHSGTGTFEVNNISMVDGAKYLDASYTIDARGGCIYSTGFVSLNNSYLKYCHAATANTDYRGAGGAVYAAGGVTVSNSEILLSGSGTDTLFGVSGGIHSGGEVILVDSAVALNSATLAGGVGAVGGSITKYSSISDNYAYRAGGGLYSLSNTIIQNSTIEGNGAGTFGGGAVLIGYVSNTVPITLQNSTVSGNTAVTVGGLFVLGYPAQIANSTIAFNQETGAAKYGAGIYLGTDDATFESTIIAPNSLNTGSGLAPDDVGGGATVVLSGHNNLTSFVATGQVMPSDTIYGDPYLASIGSNGGTTRTHMLLPNSPAIEAGNNEAGAAADQRGSGFPRVIGTTADIGAIEFNLDDVIFFNGFD
jgi:hypothetical protein